MKTLVIGCSSIAARRALPALRSLSAISGIDAASRRGASVADAYAHRGQAFETPDRALAESDASLVYISTENGDHDRWVEAALASGRHVVIDKPAFADLATTRRRIDMAENAGLIIAEATVFLDHPRIAGLTGIMEENGRPDMVQACFSFPPLPSDNFRYDPARGGGAINDLGPYAAATGRYFFGGPPDRLRGNILKRDRVETAFVVTATWDDGRCFSGMYGFHTEYQNWISGAGPGLSFRFDRACTPPPDTEQTVSLRIGNEENDVASPAGDCFSAFFKRLVEGIEAGAGGEFHEAMLADAAFRDSLREAVA